MTESDAFTVSGSLDDVQKWFDEHRWTDGLPIVPPTEERVAAMLAGLGGILKLPSAQCRRLGPEAMLVKLATNAVMPGCKPSFFPVVVAATSDAAS